MQETPVKKMNLLNKPLAFVAMPFREPFDPTYFQSIYQPALTDAGYQVQRANEIFSPTPIIRDIHRQISDADVLLCELSMRNPNVFYELGLAHAIGKPAILISRQADDCLPLEFAEIAGRAKNEIPFDLRHIRVFLYDDRQMARSADGELEWQLTLRNQIKTAARECSDSAHLWSSPFLVDESRSWAYLLITDPAGAQVSVRCASRAIAIGRSAKNDIPVEDGQVSLEHGMIVFERDTCKYRHLSASSSTHLHRKTEDILLREGGIAETKLENRDVLLMGKTRIDVRFCIVPDLAQYQTTIPEQGREV